MSGELLTISENPSEDYPRKISDFRGTFWYIKYNIIGTFSAGSSTSTMFRSTAIEEPTLTETNYAFPTVRTFSENFRGFLCERGATSAELSVNYFLKRKEGSFVLLEGPQIQCTKSWNFDFFRPIRVDSKLGLDTTFSIYMIVKGWKQHKRALFCLRNCSKMTPRHQHQQPTISDRKNDQKLFKSM